MKKIILMLFLILLIPREVSGLTINEMEVAQIEYKEILSFDKPEGYVGIQGMAITNKYYVVAVINADETKTALVIIDKKTKELAALDTNPVIDYNFGHANDMEYDSVTNELYIVNNNSLYVLNASTFKLIKEIALPDNLKVMAIAKDNQGNYYFRNRDTSYKYDADLKFISKFSVENLSGYQGLAYQNGQMYYSCYPKLTIEDTKVNNLIYVYNNEKLEHIFSAPNEYGELEATEFDNGIPYMLFRSLDKKGRIYIPVYENVSVNLTVKDQTSDIIDATLSSTNKTLEQVKKENDKYTFSPLTYSEPGTYIYKIEKVSTSKATNASESINVAVDVKYDGTKNKLVADINYESEEFKEAPKDTIVPEDTDKNESKDNKDKTNEIENPKTGFKIIYTILLILGFIIIMNIRSKKRLYKL